MKCHAILFVLFLPILLSGQTRIDYNEREMISMSETRFDRYENDWAYFKKGEEKPFTGILYAARPDGTYESVQEFREGRGNGTWINYYENGNIREMGTYVDDRVEGPVKMYYPDGTLKAAGTYGEWRVRVGCWSYYLPDGTPEKTEDYGQSGDFRDVEAFYQRGEISRSFYERIRATYDQ